MYKPLPEELTIKISKIHGLGLFATKEIEKNHEFGISHIKHSDFSDGYIRTPLGGFFNHSSKPNCEAYKKGEYVRLRSIQPISIGEELTVKYWLYEIEESDEIL